MGYRLWVDDRPGALADVTACLARLGVDVVAVEVVDRGGGRAVDELVVGLGPDRSPGEVARALARLDGVDVEDVRLGADDGDRRVAALEAAAGLGAAAPGEAPLALALAAGELVRATWAAVVAPDGDLAAVNGPVPDPGWLAALAGGLSAAPAGVPPPDGEIAWARLDRARHVLVVERRGVPFRPTEHRALALLARLADLRLADALAPAR